MAQVSISVADIQIGVEDEDESAKALKKLALSIVNELVDKLGAHPDDKDEEGSQDCCEALDAATASLSPVQRLGLRRAHLEEHEEDVDG
jgi:hypothetical protein